MKDLLKAKLIAAGIPHDKAEELINALQIRSVIDKLIDVLKYHVERENNRISNSQSESDRNYHSARLEVYYETLEDIRILRGRK